jgi:hypothetical protein
MANDRQKLAQQNMRIAQANKNRSLGRQGLQATSGARTMSENMQQIEGRVKPGNIGAINRVIWPFWFTFTAPQLGPNVSSSGFTTITQEAGFVWMSYTKSVFKRTAGPVYTYVDPDAVGLTGQSDGLKFSVRDSSSSRQFHNNPLELDMVGHPEYPSVLETPIMFLPNSTIEIAYTNQHASNTYVPFVTLFGYRIRVEDAENIMSLVSG